MFSALDISYCQGIFVPLCSQPRDNDKIRLGLLGDNDYPYAVPNSYVYASGRLYFHSALSGHIVDAIRKCDGVIKKIENKN